MCRQAIDGGGEVALDVALETGQAPSSSTHHAVLQFLGGDFARYAELDFDGSLLRSAHTAAHERVRARLARQARTSGRVDWVRAIAGVRRTGSARADRRRLGGNARRARRGVDMLRTVMGEEAGHSPDPSAHGRDLGRQCWTGPVADVGLVSGPPGMGGCVDVILVCD
jgi:hypothetical protein